MKAKERLIKHTAEAKFKREYRTLMPDCFSKDLQEEKPIGVLEQVCETVDERKFRVYYMQKYPYAHCYVMVINGEIRLITLWRENISKQKDISKLVDREKR